MLDILRKKMKSKHNLYKSIIVLIFLSFIFSKSYSRLTTTIDPPSKYHIIGTNLDSHKISDESYDNKLGINIAYEHLILSREKINLYVGGEYMIGKQSLSTMAFHSLYIMPLLSIKEKFAISTRLGLTQLNTDQENFNLEFGYVTSIAFEYKLSNKMAFSLSYSVYNMQNKKVTSTSGIIPPSGSDIGGGDTESDNIDLDLTYNKIGVSFIYGFEIITQRGKNEKN